MARGTGDSVLVFAVAEPADYDGVEDEAVTAAISNYLRQAAEGEAAALRAEGVEATVAVDICSRVDAAILDQARKVGADLIIMGTHGRTGLARAVIGSVADRVLRHSEIPVLLVRLVTQRDAGE